MAEMTEVCIEGRMPSYCVQCVILSGRTPRPSYVYPEIGRACPYPQDHWLRFAIEIQQPALKQQLSISLSATVSQLHGLLVVRLLCMWVPKPDPRLDQLGNAGRVSLSMRTYMSSRLHVAVTGSILKPWSALRILHPASRGVAHVTTTRT